MSESSNFSSSSSFDSINDFGGKMADDPPINHLSSRLPGINSGSRLSGVNVNFNSASTITHPGYKSLMDALDFLRTLQTPIEFAFYLYEINDYLRNVVIRKENRLRKRGFNETLTSDAASVASFRIQALQEQYYSSFYGRATNINALSSNSMANPSFHPSQNSFLIPQRNEAEGQSSLFEKSRNPVSQINNSVIPRNRSHSQNPNSFGNQQKFSELEDTGKSNSMLFENSRRFIKPGPLHSSFMGKSRNNISSFQVNSSILSENHSRQNHSSAPLIGEIEEDQFSCVRVGPLSKKFHLPAVQEVEEESESLSSLSLSEEEGPAKNNKNDDKPKDQKNSDNVKPDAPKKSSTYKSKVQTNASKNAKPNLQKNSLDNDKSIMQTNSSNNEFVLTNWTVVLIDKNLHLKGTKLIKKKIVEKNHLSKEILYRSRRGIIRTKDDCFYTLEPPFVDNEDMPEKVKHFFRSKKFPLVWRCMLSTWIQEKNGKSDLDTKVKRRPNLENNTKESKKVNGSQKNEDRNPKNSRLRKKPLGKTNEAESKKSKKPASSGTAKKKPEQEKNNISEENGEIGSTFSSQETNSKRAGNKNKKPTSSGTIKKKPKPVKSKNISEDLNGDVESSSSSEESSNGAKNKKKINKNLQKQVNGGGTSGKTSKQNKNCFENFEESVLNSSSRDKNSYTPNALLRSITKSSALSIGRHTPPLKLIGEMLKKNNVKSNAHDTSSEICPENYLVAKRIKKTKGSKKVRNNKKEESPADDEVQNLLMALTNKTPQTTPKAIREVFRNEEESRNSDSDFGSDISSI